MKKGILVLVLASVVVADTEALLADTGGTLPRILSSEQGQANEADVDGKQALRANEDTKEAAREERVPTVPSSFQEWLGAFIKHCHDWIARMNEMNVRLKEDAAWERAAQNDWILYKRTWRNEVVAKKDTENDWWKKNEAVWKTEEAALVKLKDGFEKKKAAWGEKKAAWEERKAKLEEGALEKETTAWEQEEAGWNKESDDLREQKKLLTSNVLSLKLDAAEKQINHCLPYFEELQRCGATPDDYEEVVRLDKEIVKKTQKRGSHSRKHFPLWSRVYKILVFHDTYR